MHFSIFPSLLGDENQNPAYQGMCLGHNYFGFQFEEDRLENEQVISKNVQKWVVFKFLTAPLAKIQKSAFVATRDLAIHKF